MPVFLPHLGCRQKCIYCNQQHITGKEINADIKETIKKSLDALRAPAEIAIYGGNPFGLGTDRLAQLFDLFARHKEKIETIRISTEPIPPDSRMIDLLRNNKVTTVELGIPVFSDEKLRALGRRHTVEDLYRTHEALVRAGFTVGIQVMVGLPGETAQDIRSTVEHSLRLKPAFMRIYPLVVLRGTLLHEAFLKNEFRPLTIQEAVQRALFIYLQAEAASIKVIKMGLTENEFLKGEIVAGPYHPAFGYLVRAEAFYLAVLKVCKERGLAGAITVLLSKKDVPHLTGYRRSNLKRFEEQGLDVEWKETGLASGEFLICAPEKIADANFHSRGDRGGSEEPHPRAGTRAYLGARRRKRCSDNEGMRVKGNWHQDAISMLPF